MVICSDNYLMTMVLFDRFVAVNITKFTARDEIIGSVRFKCDYNSYVYKKLAKTHDKEHTEFAEKTLNHIYIMMGGKKNVQK